MDENICCVNIWNKDKLAKTFSSTVTDAIRLGTGYRKEALLFAAKHGCDKSILYCIKEYDQMDSITTVNYYKSNALTEEELDEITRKNPTAWFGVFYPQTLQSMGQRMLEEEESKRIVPLTLKEANAFVSKNHRHHGPTTGCKFAVGLVKKEKGQDKLIGAAICGRPVSRIFDTGTTLEINRLCTTEGTSSCSRLYGACIRIAREMGYQKVITYILESEKGSSLRAAGFKLEDPYCGGTKWNGKRKRTNNSSPEEMKQRWAVCLKN